MGTIVNYSRETQSGYMTEVGLVMYRLKRVFS
jgi:hypothetical protein